MKRQTSAVKTVQTEDGKLAHLRADFGRGEPRGVLSIIQTEEVRGAWVPAHHWRLTRVWFKDEE